ncbi:CBS domain containing protein [Alkaliphilus metalliredigens QYMF]|uniref:CBS domain containing protein n=1 Tax=Alkaliphilus metalliredigens (strain QYMF) TaxID=293826 RepID=A6TSJ3_ALKMQ|nr:helix-turn-helix transcriptional regulator [Alkaliphilus metalliredigens]ABR49161.1 CBS domain containing protein [Alkaliphilus metalliredigens QYMF]
MSTIEFSKRQKKIMEIVQQSEPITSEKIASMLEVTRATLRPDLAILTMSGILDARPKVGYFYSGKSQFNLFSEEVKRIKVETMMSLPIVVTEETSVYDAIVTLFLEDVGTIFVASKGYLSGVISRKDFLKSAIGGTDMNKVPVGMVMTRRPNILTIGLKDSVLDAAIKILDHEVDSLPVVEREIVEGKEQLKIIGRISKSNVTKLFVELCKA